MATEVLQTMSKLDRQKLSPRRKNNNIPSSNGSYIFSAEDDSIYSENSQMDESLDDGRNGSTTPPRGRKGVTSTTPPRRRRRSPTGGQQSSGPGSVITSGAFIKLTILVILVALFDVISVWNVIDDLDRKDGTEPHHQGPEAGMHNLHRTRRMGSLYQHFLSSLQLKQLDSNKDSLSSLMNDELDAEAIENAETAVPNEGNDDGKSDTAQKKSKAKLNTGETFGVDDHIVRILRAANVELDEELAKQLPTWDDIVSQYGPSPIIRGLETCEPYRKAVKPEDRMIGPAGLFNTGTNLLFELMKENCDIKEARKYHREPRQNGMRWQVPWGKHNPPNTHRLKNVAKAWGKGIKQEDFMPVVLIKDPFHWMGSQCRHKYTTFWGHDEKHCPNLIRWRVPDKDETAEARVKWALDMVVYESLLDIWNRWNNEWEEQTFPALHTRFEDLLFHGEDVVRTACDCVGGVFTDNFQYKEDSAKKTVGVHKGANGLVKAMLQYGDPKKRLVGFTDRDRWYASKTVDANLMRKYGYSSPPLPT